MAPRELPVTIQSIGFVDTSLLTAWFTLRMRKDHMHEGVIELRSLRDDQLEPEDCEVLKGWKSARAMLSRIRAGAAPFFSGVAPTLGRAWIETLAPGEGTPWYAETGDYAEQYLRTRTCLIPAPGAATHCGSLTASLNVGIITLVDHRLLCSEVNHGDHERVHLVVDVKPPVRDDAAD